MGYWGQQERYGEKKIDAIIRREFSRDNLEVLDTASRGNIHYLAVKITPLDGSDAIETIGFVCLTRQNKGYLDIKVMDEYGGPYYCDAPKRLVKKLTPTTDETANAWRQACLSR